MQFIPFSVCYGGLGPTGAKKCQLLYLHHMDATVLKCILQIASADNAAAPHLRPVYPDQIVAASGLSEEMINDQLAELFTKQLVKFVATDTKVVTLTKSGVQVAQVL